MAQSKTTKFMVIIVLVFFLLSMAMMSVLYLSTPNPTDVVDTGTQLTGTVSGQNIIIPSTLPTETTGNNN